MCGLRALGSLASTRNVPHLGGGTESVPAPIRNGRMGESRCSTRDKKSTRRGGGDCLERSITRALLSFSLIGGTSVLGRVAACKGFLLFFALLLGDCKVLVCEAMID
ncbi:hypothetical protein AG1IA_10209 [Rhizoctonia solani AG-1 IA]|uniref:Uncharacterized protein n=1 Tax=Thanatephorus cucumeris (strain AG1-IA) TaxID=983506 RepID=L8WC67_THACA|nr:hypothetical protein AG1IA_10209 [Rhizoctonia solani AG-1 IA]